MPEICRIPRLPALRTKSRTKNFRNSQNSSHCVFHSIPADDLKYSLTFIHQFPWGLLALHSCFRRTLVHRGSVDYGPNPHEVIECIRRRRRLDALESVVYSSDEHIAEYAVGLLKPAAVFEQNLLTLLTVADLIRLPMTGSHHVIPVTLEGDWNDK
jgi:hypothetical protein